jgi:hypothetical protein
VVAWWRGVVAWWRGVVAWWLVSLWRGGVVWLGAKLFFARSKIAEDLHNTA